MTGAALTATAVSFARAVVTPRRHKPDDLEVLQVGPRRVVLSATADTVVPGRYGVWTDGGRGHFRVGDVLEVTEERVTRELLGVDAGVPVPGRARWNQYYFAGDPTTALDLPHEDVLVPSDVGALPCWSVPGPADGRPDTWAVLVHGRGATREEALRAVPVLHGLGLPCLVPAYRNDADAPTVEPGLYGLGDTEWRDVEAVARYALDRGARRLLLVGWSMGGAIVLQFVARSPLAEHVRPSCWTGPSSTGSTCWTTRRARPGSPSASAASGCSCSPPRGPSPRRRPRPVDLRAMDWVRRAEELQLPALLLHSDADDYVPSGPSQRLAQARPDLITYVASSTARHTKEWNVDPQGWESAVREFVAPRLGADA